MDNVAITAGAGTTVSTEEITTLNGGAVAAQHVQRIAAALRTADGAAIDLPGNATDGLLVNLGANNDVAISGTVTVAAHAVTNAGVFAVQVDGAALTALQLIDDAVATAGAAITAKGLAAAGTDGTNARILKTDAAGELQVDVLSLPSVTIGAALPAGANNIGDVDVLSVAAGSNLIGDVGIQGRTTGGLSIFRSLDLDETEEEVKATAGTIYWINATNRSTGVRYLKLYNDTAVNVVVGTTAPVMTIPLPTNGDANGVALLTNIVQGLAFGAAITAAVTTGLADADTGAPGLNDVIVHIGFK